MCKPYSGVYSDESARNLGSSVATNERCRAGRILVSAGLAAANVPEQNQFAMRDAEAFDILPLGGEGIREGHAAHLLARLKDGIGAPVRGCFDPHAGTGTGSITAVGPPDHPSWTGCLLLHSEQVRMSLDPLKRSRSGHEYTRSAASGIPNCLPLIPRPPPVCRPSHSIPQPIGKFKQIFTED